MHFEINTEEGKRNLFFFDLGDYERVQMNVIDNQRMYESVVINNSFSQISRVIGSLNRREASLSSLADAFTASKICRIL